MTNNVSVFTSVRAVDGRDTALLDAGRMRAVFPIDPFMVMGVASDTSERMNSVPPTVAGGNIDIRNLTVGSKSQVRVRRGMTPVTPSARHG